MRPDVTRKLEKTKLSSAPFSLRRCGLGINLEVMVGLRQIESCNGNRKEIKKKLTAGLFPLNMLAADFLTKDASAFCIKF